MDNERLARLLRDGQHEDAAELITRYTVPLVTSLTEDRIIHDLAVEGAEIMSGTFTPAGAQVMVDVDAAFAFLGFARAALLLYVGQPDVPGTRLYDSGGKPVAGAKWYSVASNNGENAWAHTTHRRLVLDVDPAKAVTWQILGAIIGSSAVFDVVAPRRLAITPDGTKAFVTSPSEGTVTPAVLGRPGYTYDQQYKPMDEAQAPVSVGASPTDISCDDAHVVVSNVDATEDHVTVMSVATHEIVRHVTLPGGRPSGSALTPDGSHAIVGTRTGSVARIALEDGEVTTVAAGEEIRGVDVLGDGTAAFVADAANGNVYRIGLPDLSIDAKIGVGDTPHAVEVAPDGQVWVLCRPPSPAVGRLKQIDPATNDVVNDFPLPYPAPEDLAIVPVAGQTSEVVRTAWVVFEGGRYCQMNIGGNIAGQVHSFHNGGFGEDIDAASAVAINDYGEIWVVQPDLDRVWKWPGGRLVIRADDERPYSGVFFGEYCDVSVYGAQSS